MEKLNNWKKGRKIAKAREKIKVGKEQPSILDKLLKRADRPVSSQRSESVQMEKSECPTSTIPPPNIPGAKSVKRPGARTFSWPGARQ